MRRPYFKALAGDEGIDRITLEVVPRFKESELSGDEWRTSVKVTFYRKGKPMAEKTFGTMKGATAAVGWFFQTVHETSPVPLWGLDDCTCAQYGCDQEAVRVVQLKKEFSAQGEGPLPKEGDEVVRRAFCVGHRHRGNASRKDSEQNYQNVDVPSEQGKS